MDAADAPWLELSRDSFLHAIKRLKPGRMVKAFPAKELQIGLVDKDRGHARPDQGEDLANPQEGARTPEGRIARAAGLRRVLVRAAYPLLPAADFSSRRAASTDAFARSGSLSIWFWT